MNEIDGKPKKSILDKKILNPVWLSVSESAKICGVAPKTIRRAIQAKSIAYKIVNDRYRIDFASLIKYFFSNKKLKNKLHQFGIGQYIKKWRE